jgi:hypothetical protein
MMNATGASCCGGRQTAREEGPVATAKVEQGSDCGCQSDNPRTEATDAASRGGEVSGAASAPRNERRRGCC